MVLGALFEECSRLDGIAREVGGLLVIELAGELYRFRTISCGSRTLYLTLVYADLDASNTGPEYATFVQKDGSLDLKIEERAVSFRDTKGRLLTVTVMSPADILQWHMGGKAA